MKQLIAITMGDPAGVGPEVIVKAMASHGLSMNGDYLIVGNTKILQLTAQSLGISVDFVSISTVDEIPNITNKIPVLEPFQHQLPFNPGSTNAACGPKY